MVNKHNVEKFFDVIDESANILYEELKYDYLKGVYLTVENILENDVLQQEITDDVYNKLMAIYDRIDDFEFKKEEIRKAMQLCILKGFKHRKVLNGDMTPDTLGIFLNYIVNKFYDNKEITVLDPLVGTGNLLATMANNSENKMTFFGVDRNEEMIQISKALMDLLGYDIELYLQDTLTGVLGKYDLIVSDLPDQADDDKYIPGEVVKLYLKHLKADCPMVVLIPNTFFNIVSKESILEEANLEGLIKLPNELFKQGYEKSILFLTKKGKRVSKDFLLLDLKSVTDPAIVTEAMESIDHFFKKR